MESKVEYKVIEARSALELDAELNMWASRGWSADMASLVVVNTTGPHRGSTEWGYTIIMCKWSASE